VYKELIRVYDKVTSFDEGASKRQRNSKKGESMRGRLKTFQRLSPEKWLKPRPEPGLDCLICAEFTPDGMQGPPNGRGIRREASRPDTLQRLLEGSRDGAC